MSRQLTAIDPRTAKRSRLAQWLCGEGIEIGALNRPLPVPAAARVHYVDRLPLAELRRYYAEVGDEGWPNIDIIGDVEDLSGIADSTLDFAIASHLVEHLPLPARGLREMLRVLKPDGVLFLILPDQRVGIDHARAVTPVEHLIETIDAAQDS